MEEEGGGEEEEEEEEGRRRRRRRRRRRSPGYIHKYDNLRKKPHNCSAKIQSQTMRLFTADTKHVDKQPDG
jgi:hypothetical protein